MTFPVFDSHCHLDAEAFDADRGAVVARAVDAGVCGLVIPATSRASCARVVDLVSRLPELAAYGAVGVHPHDAREVDDAEMEEIEALLGRPGIVAVGETGLDYHYNLSPPDVQRAALRAHVRLAVRTGRPLILHCRDAEADLLEILESENGAAAGGVVHCFCSDADTASRLLALGFYLGFTGMITFRNADALRAVVKQVPIERLLVETDSPYLAPVPFRGKRNEPAHVARVAEAVAALHGLTPEAAARIAADNTRRCFRLD